MKSGHKTDEPLKQTVNDGEKVEPINPATFGWVFGGWYTEAACTNPFDFDTPITADVTLYAKWTELSSLLAKIKKITATSNMDAIVGYLNPVQDPTFTVTEGAPAHLEKGSWLKQQDDGTWQDFTETNFDAGIYRYKYHAVIDGEAAAQYTFDDDFTVNMDGRKEDCDPPFVDMNRSEVDVTTTRDFLVSLPDTYTVTIATPIEHGTVTADRVIGLSKGEVVTLTIAAEEGYELEYVNVKDYGENPVPMQTETTFEMPAAHVIVHAAFKAKNVLPPAVEKFTITVDPNGGNWAGDTAKKTYEIANGGSFMLPEAPVKQGYTFLFWKGSAYRPGDH